MRMLREGEHKLAVYFTPTAARLWAAYECRSVVPLESRCALLST